MKMKNGFTMIELIVVMVIMGIMATFAIPRLTGQTVQAQAGEGIQVLIALHSSQLRYCLEHANLCVSGTYPACGTYDVDIPALNNFDPPDCANTGNISVAHDDFTLTVTPAGVYSCTGTCDTINRIKPQ